MKEVLAILRPDAWAATKVVVSRFGFAAFTQRRVLGRGASRGIPRLSRRSVGHRGAIGYFPKRLVSWIVADEAADGLVELLVAANRTGNPGDGRIWVLPVTDAVRIRTGERGAVA